MKILCVIDSLGSGGAQRQIINLACALATRNHHIEFFVYHQSNHFYSILAEADIQVHLYQKKSRFSVKPFVALRKIIAQRAFDIVLAFLDIPNFYSEISRIGLKKPKLVVSERSMYLVGKLPLTLRLLQESHRLADAITVNSHHQRKRMMEEFPWMTKKIQTIYSGFDLNAFSPIDSVKKNDKKLSLLAISSVSFNKNSMNLAKALAICRDKFQLVVHVDWIGTQQISGEGTCAAQQTINYLREKGLFDHWDWLGERTDIPQMLASHDALIHPSYFEGLPNVVCEALACGRPVLASKVCDNPVLVQDNMTGYLFDPDSAEDIAKTIVTFSRLETSTREAMGRAARTFAENHLSLKRYVDEYENLFLRLSKESTGLP